MLSEETRIAIMAGLVLSTLTFVAGWLLGELAERRAARFRRADLAERAAGAVPSDLEAWSNSDLEAWSNQVREAERVRKVISRMPREGEPHCGNHGGRRDPGLLGANSSRAHTPRGSPEHLEGGSHDICDALRRDS